MDPRAARRDTYRRAYRWASLAFPWGRPARIAAADIYASLCRGATVETAIGGAVIRVGYVRGLMGN